MRRGSAAHYAVPERSRLRTLIRHARYHGVWSAAVLVVLQPLQHLRLLRVGGVYRSPTTRRSDLPAEESKLDARFLDEAEVRKLVEAGAEWFFPEAVKKSLLRGERCFAVLVEGQVVNSRWIAPGPLRQFGVYLVAASNTLFEQRVFTSPVARGAGLATRAQRLVGAQLREEGIEWTLATIDVVNAASIAAFRKAGAHRVGWIVQLGPDSWGLARLIRTSSACPNAEK